MRIIGLMSVRNESDVIEYTLRHLISNGIELIVLNDDSNDGTLEILQRYLGDGVLDIFTRKSKTMALQERFNLLYRRALVYSPDWILIVDTDEFMYSDVENETLKEGIERIDRLGYKTIRFAEIRFVITSIDDMSERDPRKRMHYFRTIDYSPNWRAYNLNFYNDVIYKPHIIIGSDSEWYPDLFYFKHYPERTLNQVVDKVEDRRERYSKFEGTGVHYTTMSLIPSRYVHEPEKFNKFDFSHEELVEKLKTKQKT